MTKMIYARLNPSSELNIKYVFCKKKKINTLCIYFITFNFKYYRNVLFFISITNYTHIEDRNYMCLYFLVKFYMKYILSNY